MKILANDGLDNIAVEELKKLDIEIDLNHYDDELLINKLKEVDIVIIRSATKLTSKILEKTKNTKLKLLIRAGVGLDNIDVEYAKNNGYIVRNTPNSSANSVAEFVIGAIVSLARFIPIANFTCKNKKWNKKQYQGIEIQGKTLGIIGMGNIGKLLAKKADALGMKVVFYDKFVNKCENYAYLSLEDLLRTSDFISIHTPFVRDNFISTNEFNIMKDGCYIVNTSRGDNLDEDALITAIENGKVAGCFMDVLKKEPIENEKLMQNDKIYLSPHLGGATDEAQQKIGMEIIDIVKEFINM